LTTLRELFLRVQATWDTNVPQVECIYNNNPSCTLCTLGSDFYGDTGLKDPQSSYYKTFNFSLKLWVEWNLVVDDVA